MIFNMASERINNLKEYAIKLLRHELMFKEFKALDDVSFVVNRGDVFGLMGTNGSGKSTMLKIIAGVLDPSRGACEVNGSIAPLIELGAGFDLELTARENIYLNGALLGYSKQFLEEHFQNIVDFADIHGFLDMPMKNYSSGMVARIAFAIATEVIPDILIVDEVLSVGDFMFQQKCERRIRSLIEDHGVTVLIVSHDNNMIRRLCNKAIWIEKGHTRAYGKASDVCDLYKILGGHSGNSESQDIVQDIYNTEVEIPNNAIASISADDRFNASVSLLEESKQLKHFDSLILAPGDSEQVCLIANSLAGLMDIPVLPIREGSIPSVIGRAIRDIKPRHIILFKNPIWFNNGLTNALKDEYHVSVDVIDGSSFDDMAVNAYNYGTQLGFLWGNEIAVTHEACIADHISLYPYLYHKKVPVFFNYAPGKIIESIQGIIKNGSFGKLLVIGGTVSFPDSCLKPFLDSGIAMDRFNFRGGYEASVCIAEWILAHDNHFTTKNILISSVWNPENALTIGRYASLYGDVILMEDPGDLDSIVYTFNFIAKHKDATEKLIFLGDTDKYNANDKQMLAKALVMDPVEYTETPS